MTTDLADATDTPAQITFMMRAPWFDVDNDVHLGACDDVNRDVEGVQVHPSTDGAVTTITVTVAGAWKSPEWSRAMEAIDYLHDRCKQARREPAEPGCGGSAGAGPTGDGSRGHGTGRGGVAAGDRTVHAAQPRHPGGLELVRYGRAGKWYVESAATLTKIERVGIERAAELAVIWVAEGGEVYLGQPGGRAFDTAVVAAGGRTVLAADRGGQR